MKRLNYRILFGFTLLLFAAVSCKKEDDEAPVITLNGSEYMSVGIGSNYVELGAQAIDNKDGELVPLVKGLVNVNSVKTYTIIYTVADKSANSATIYRYVSVKNLMQYLVGDFTTQKLEFDSLGTQILDTTYKQNIATSSTINYRINFLKFGNITFAPTSTRINADVSSNGATLTIPLQSALTKINNVVKTHYYRGSGSIVGDSLLAITYFDSLPNRTPNRCTLSLKRQ